MYKIFNLFLIFSCCFLWHCESSAVKEAESISQSSATTQTKTPAVLEINDPEHCSDYIYKLGDTCPPSPEYKEEDYDRPHPANWTGEYRDTLPGEIGAFIVNILTLADSSYAYFAIPCYQRCLCVTEGYTDFCANGEPMRSGILTEKYSVSMFWFDTNQEHNGISAVFYKDEAEIFSVGYSPGDSLVNLTLGNHGYDLPVDNQGNIAWRDEVTLPQAFIANMIAYKEGGEFIDPFKDYTFEKRGAFTSFN